ncbi:hypothetical protein [Aquimarina longa]|uniref:hypothetical protein n=1 Tax=Aquimarina longa TaxID=1080221 RepID=UPI0007829488|nr:hypothetical protein [Aquimarina longa]
MNSINLEIKKLKQLLKKDQIEISEAANILTQILNKYNNEFEISQDQLILQGISKFNVSIKSLLNDRKKVTERINSLNTIIIFQELGVTFSEDELKDLLKK